MVWKKVLGPVATVGMGPGTSPVLFENLLILLCDEDNGDRSFIAALDKSEGREVWRMERRVEASWATPLLVRSRSRAEIVCSGFQTIAAYDARSGTEVWRMKGLDSNAIPSPVAGHGMVFVSSGFPAKKTFAIKLGGSGDLTETPGPRASPSPAPTSSGTVIGQSGAYNQGDDAVIRDVREGAKRDVVCHLTVGTYENALGGDPVGGNLLEAQRRFAAALKARGYVVEAREVPEGLSWGLWRADLGRALKFLLGPNPEKPYDAGGEPR